MAMINFAILKSKNLFVYAIFGLFFFLLFALLMGQIPQYFSGEEFYVLHYANNFNFQEAIRLYFNQNGRLVEGIYWTLLYKTIGYNPPAAHFLSFFIHFATSIFASLCFIKIWPGKKLAFSKALLVILFFFNWFSLQWAFRLSADNMRISVLLYFVSGYLLQKWIATSGNLKYFYLSGAVILFLVSIFAYENTAFLFPALIFMAWPLRSQQGKSKNDGLANKLFILGIISLGFIFVPYYIYLIVGESLGRVIQHPATGGIVTNMDAFRVLLNWFYNLLYFIKGPVGFSYIVTLFLLCVGFYTIFVSGNRKKPFTDDGFLSRSLCISLASLWIIAMGLLPYSIANYVSTERVNSAAIFGLPPLLVLVFDIQKTKIIKTLSVLVIFYSISLGLIQYRDTSIERALREPELNGFYIGLKSVVPYVKAKTVFVFINYPLSNSGCGPSLNMLYDQTDLECAFLSSSLYEYRAIRYVDYIQANRGGGLRDENWVLILIDANNRPTVVSEINPGDFDLLIEWIDRSPIRTDYRRIENGENVLPSEMYLDLLRRNKILFSR